MYVQNISHLDIDFTLYNTALLGLTNKLKLLDQHTINFVS